MVSEELELSIKRVNGEIAKTLLVDISCSKIRASNGEKSYLGLGYTPEGRHDGTFIHNCMQKEVYKGSDPLGLFKNKKNIPLAFAEQQLVSSVFMGSPDLFSLEESFIADYKFYSGRITPGVLDKFFKQTTRYQLMIREIFGISIKKIYIIIGNPKDLVKPLEYYILDENGISKFTKIIMTEVFG